MKRLLSLLAATLVAVAGCEKPQPTAGSGPAGNPAEAASYAMPKEGGKVELNSDNTHIEWAASASKPMPHSHKGKFTRMTGATKLTTFGPGQQFKEQPAPLESLSVEIDATSIDSDTPKLTDHLKKDDFFAVTEFPKITFKSTKIEPVPGKINECIITGDLTIRDKKVSITFPAKISKEKTFYMEAAFDLSRKEIGQKFGADNIDDKVNVKVTVGKPVTK